ncbi:MAG: hypothetical protein IJ246_08775 [Clostridia bacterium]|nr:hypothetical protein [Clostridia bacterium]
MSDKKNTDLIEVSEEKKPTPEITSSPRKLPVILAVLVMLVAIALGIVVYQRNHQMEEEIAQLKSDLTESQNHWQAVSEEKEVLQKDLDDIESSIREAKLTIEESSRKIEDVQEQVASLSDLNTTLTAQLSALQSRSDSLTRVHEALEDTESRLHSAIVVLKDQMEKRDGVASGGLWAGLQAARLAMLDVWRTELQSLRESETLVVSQLDTLPDIGFEAQADELSQTLIVIRQRIETVEAHILEYDSQVD